MPVRARYRPADVSPSPSVDLTGISSTPLQWQICGLRCFGKLVVGRHPGGALSLAVK